MSTKQNPSYPSSPSRRTPALQPSKAPEPPHDDQTTSSLPNSGLPEEKTNIQEEKTAASIELPKAAPLRPMPVSASYPRVSKPVSQPVNKPPKPVEPVETAAAPAPEPIQSEPTSIQAAPQKAPASGEASASFPSASSSSSQDPSASGRSRRKRGIPSDALPPEVRAVLDSFQLASADPERYDLGDEFARGGLGRIRRATDKHLDREVAIKELIHAKGTTRHRFLREALITARLEHPSIVPVHDAGRWPSGEAFYTMKMVSGRSLDDLIDENSSLESRLILLPHVIDVCEAIAYAHSKKIIHRDIKPANVLIGSFGETVVIDWGLAKDLNNPKEDDPIEVAPQQMSQAAKAVAAGLTVDGAVIGTPAYMSPEQVNAKKVDERSDVYALGALLYHVLAGDPPYDGNNSFEILANVALKPPKPLLSKEPNIPPDLVAIVEKAMSKDPEKRYPTAKEMAQDLKRFQSGQLVGARSYSNVDLFKRFAKKYRLPLAIAAASFVVLAIFGSISVYNIIDSKNAADAARLVAEEEKQTTEARSNELAILQARTSVNQDPTTAMAWLKLMSPQGPGWEEARIISADAHGLGVARQVLRGHKGAIHWAAPSSDGKRLATASADGTVRLWDIDTGMSTSLEGHTNEVLWVAFSPDNTKLASASKDDTVRLWDISCASPKSPEGCSAAKVFIGHQDASAGAFFSQVAFSPNGMALAAANTDGSVRVWSLPDLKERVLQGHSSDVNRVAFSLDGKKLASASNDSAVLLWDLGTGTSKPFRGHSGAVFDVAFSPDGKKLASASEDMTVRLWDISTGYANTLQGHQDTINLISFSPDGKKLVSASDDKMLRLWDVETKKGQLLSGHKDAVLSATFSPDGKQILSTSRDSTARLWDTTSLNGRALMGHKGAVSYAAFSMTGKLFYTTGEDGSLRVWDLQSGFSQVQSGHEDFVNSVVFSPDGQMIASASVDHTVRLWNFKTHESRVLIVHEDEVTQTMFSPDGRLVASAGKDNTVRLFELESGKSQILPGVERPVHQIAFSKDGSLIAAATDDKIVHYWEVKTGKDHILRGHRDTIRFVAFSPDGMRLASASEDKTIRVWDLTKDAQIAVLSGHQGFVNHVAFSPDGMLLASASSDQSVRLWDLATNMEKAKLPGHKDSVLQVAFSPDGTKLASSGKDSMVFLWSLANLESTPLAGHKNWVTQLFFSTDGMTLVSASKDYSVRLWSTMDPSVVRSLAVHEGPVMYATLSPDGKTLATSSRDQSTILWDITDPKVNNKYDILFCHQIYLAQKDLPKKPDELLGWLNSVTSAAIVGGEVSTPAN